MNAKTSMTDSRLRLILFALITALALVLGFSSFSASGAVEAFKNWGYLLTLAAFAGLLAHLWRLIRWRLVWDDFSRGGWRIAVFIVLLAAFMHVQDRHGFKVVNDELVLLATSKQMHETREAAWASRGYELGTNFVAMQASTDKRPLFYPLLVSLLHDLTGYRPENTFVLNGLLTPLLLFLVYAVARRLSGPGAGLAAVLLLATVPLLIQTVTGGGFEVLNLVMIALTVLLGMVYAEDPSTDALAAFCLSGVLLAQVRYESVLFVAPVAIVVLWTWWRLRKFDLPWAVIFSPLLLVGYPWQYQLMKLQPTLWQLKDRPSEHGVFSFAYFYENVGHALNYFLSFDHTQGNSHLILVAGLIGAGFFWMVLYREHRVIFRERPGEATFVVFALAMFGLSGLLLCYFWGAFDDMITTRLSLPMQLLMAWLFVYSWPKLIKAAIRWRVVVWVCVGYLLVWTIPTMLKRAYAFQNLTAETVNWIRPFIRDRLPKNSLVFDSNHMVLWLACEVPALTLDGLAAREREFLYHYHRHTFDNYLVVQRLEPPDFKAGNWRPIGAEEDLTTVFKLEPLDQIVLTPIYAVRISRIVTVSEPEFEAWAKRRLESHKAIAKSGTIPWRDDPEAHRYAEEWLRNLP
jgi:hypothetical protein